MEEKARGFMKLYKYTTYFIYAMVHTTLHHTNFEEELLYVGVGTKIQTFSRTKKIDSLQSNLTERELVSLFCVM